MRVLLFIKVPPPITGATLMNEMVLNSKIIENRFNVRAIRISYAKSLTDLGSRNAGKFIIFLKIIIRLFNECLFHRPGFIYFQISPLGIPFYRDALFVFIIKLFRVHILFHLHGKGINQAARRRWKHWLYSAVFKNESVICLSELLTFDIEGFNISKKYIVNNGIPVKNCTYTGSNHKEKFLTVLFLSNLIFSKGIIDYLEVLSILRKKNLQFRGLIIGNEADLNSSQLLHEIKIRKLQDCVEYLGPKYGDEKFAILKQVDIFAFPTKNDVWGNVILEAMQMGIPVIAYREGAISEIIDDGVNGFVITEPLPSLMAEKIEHLFNNPDLISQLGENGREKFFEKYTAQRFEEKMLNVFLDVQKRLIES